MTPSQLTCIFISFYKKATQGCFIDLMLTKNGDLKENNLSPRCCLAFYIL